MERYSRRIGVGICLAAIAIPVAWWGRQQFIQPAASPGVVAFPLSPEKRDSGRPAAELSDTDKSAIVSVIQQQLAAFQADDAELAFSFASPGIQGRFQTAEQFMAMVRDQYATVYRSQSANFEAVGWVQGDPVQAVTMVGPAGEWMIAYYQMEKQPDDTWRIAGCLLTPMDGSTI
jgi:hypothetical protein